MAPEDRTDGTSAEPTTDEVAVSPDVQQDESGEETQKLDLSVQVEDRSACERHLTVEVPREDVERYFEHEFDELMDSADVPGFRKGRAPRKLVERRFRKDVADRVKSSILMDSFAQINEQEELSPISEPDFNFDQIELPEDGPMTFEFDLEVRPEFDVPEWKGLKVQRTVHEFTEEDIDRALERFLGQYGQLVPVDEPAQSGDFIITKLTFSHEGDVVNSADDETIRIRPTLSFHDCEIKDFDKLMEGVKAGETRETTVLLSEDAPNPAFRGKQFTATFEVHEVKRLDLPELTPEFLESLGGFECEADLRDAVRDSLQRQLEYRQQQAARQQITEALTIGADWELPPTLLQRQSARELQRAVLELRRAGFTEDQIRAYENQLRRNSRESTAKALKEHFIFERIAEEESIDVEPQEYDMEIAMIAAQEGQSPRRVRAELEKGGGMDALHNQILERKVVQKILAEAEFEDVSEAPEELQDAALDLAAGGGDEDIPAAESEAKAVEQVTSEDESESTDSEA